MSDLNQVMAPFLQGQFFEEKGLKSIIFKPNEENNLNSTNNSKSAISARSNRNPINTKSVEALNKPKLGYLSSNGEVNYEQFIKTIVDFSKVQYSQISTASRRRKLSALKNFSRWCLEQELIKTDPLRSAPSSKLSERLPEYLNLEEILNYLKNLQQDFESQPEKYRNEFILFLVLYGCGLRIDEACHIKLADMDWSHSRISILGKGNKQRFAILPEFALIKLEKLILEKTVYIYGDKPLLPRTAYNWIKKRGLKACLHKPVHPHMFRHTYATHLLREKTDLRHLQELLGHASLAATQRYTHLDKDQLLQSLEAHHPLSKD